MRAAGERCHVSELRGMQLESCSYPSYLNRAALVLTVLRINSGYMYVCAGRLFGYRARWSWLSFGLPPTATAST
jgi:hypothetical protein